MKRHMKSSGSFGNYCAKVLAENNEKKALIVGVMGLGRGVGTTHLAAMIANYYCNALGFKTALVECNDHMDYIRICNEITNFKGDSRYFPYKGVDFFGCKGGGDIDDVMSLKYEVIVCDMDSQKKDAIRDFVRCDERIVVCSTAPWRIGSAKKLLSRLVNIPIKLTFLCLDKGSTEKLEREYKRAVFQIPVEGNPMSMSSRTYKWIDVLVKS